MKIMKNNKNLYYSIITSSDRCAAGDMHDKSGELIEKIMKSSKFSLHSRVILPDEFSLLENQLIEFFDDERISLILTTGGTGLSKRDVIPEVTEKLIERKIPGISEIMRIESYKNNKMSILSRSVSGVKNNTLIINLPGSPNAIQENLNILISSIEHAVEIIMDSHTGNHPQ
ncbi:MAG: molybdenum cofactor biosynthesis protein [Chloroflexi bacterium]|nr:molybdenum cofactor biosynthesis protein [Chloroflexota bacterium]